MGLLEGVRVGQRAAAIAHILVEVAGDFAPGCRGRCGISRRAPIASADEFDESSEARLGRRLVDLRSQVGVNLRPHRRSQRTAIDTWPPSQAIIGSIMAPSFLTTSRRPRMRARTLLPQRCFWRGGELRKWLRDLLRSTAWRLEPRSRQGLRSSTGYLRGCSVVFFQRIFVLVCELFAIETLHVLE